MAHKQNQISAVFFSPNRQIMIIGIDYGSKMSGTTVIASLKQEEPVNFYACPKNQDADKFILDFIGREEEIWLAYIDAPLSLPMAYKRLNGKNDYFYRQADRITGAMSPMFLGGLTARAMQLKEQASKRGVKLVETYPSKLAEVLALKEQGYKKSKENLEPICQLFAEKSGLMFDQTSVKDWHHFDALLSLYSARRFEMQSAMVFGNPEEGTITV
jgi:predicted nuclease with RNAse H fold